MADKLIIFDFSGTLSLEAARFGRPESLARYLEQSGLANMGVRPADYWQRIVIPTWQEASTAPHDFATIMAQQVRTLAPHGVPRTAIEAAAARFVAAYFQGSEVSTGWVSTLAAVSAHPDTAALVATDHYAEATAAVMGHLRGLGIPAIPVKSARTADLQHSFLIANSADIGYHKANPLFWQKLRARLGPVQPVGILLIDDFGANEADRSSYAAADAVCLRKEKTVAVLEQVFSAPVTALPFVVETTGDVKDAQNRRIQEAHRIVFDFLAAP